MDKHSYTQEEINKVYSDFIKAAESASESFSELGLDLQPRKVKSARRKRVMTRVKQIIFFITVAAIFAIIGGMDQDCFSPEAGLAAACVDFIIMAWSGFGAGLLHLPKGKRGRK